MKLKEIQKFVESIVGICSRRVEKAKEKKLPQEYISYEEGRLEEVKYILDKIEEIIYEDYCD